MTINTARFEIRELALADAPFILDLVNEPAFIANIRDSGVRSLEDAEGYLRTGPLASYAANGFGLMRVALKDSDEPVGMCGLVRRDTLPDPDLGFAFLERFWGRRYAQEAARAVMADARGRLGLKRVLGITAPHNLASGRVLETAGLRFEGLRDIGGKESRFYAWP